MSQPIHADPSASPEPDPLLAFFAEESEPSTPLKGEQAASAEKPAELAHPGEPAEAVDPRHEVTEDLRLRVQRAERLLERSLIEITTLKSDLATLVSAVEDIKRRQNRPGVPIAPPAPPGKRTSSWRAAVAAVVLLTFATLAWGLVTIVSEDLPEPPIEEAAPAGAPAPSVDAAPPPAEIQNAAIVSVTPATIARPRDVVARGDPPPRVASRSRSPTRYVGTLTIDSSPAGEVFVDRQSAGRTPLRLEKLRAGSHLIWIEREGYRRWTRVVAVAANRISRVSATLDPISR